MSLIQNRAGTVLPGRWFVAVIGRAKYPMMRELRMFGSIVLIVKNLFATPLTGQKSPLLSLLPSPDAKTEFGVGIDGPCGE
jgi:hypothetical protein